jgi:hypothetical protein
VDLSIFRCFFYSISLGLALDALYFSSEISPEVTMRKVAKILPGPVETTAALIFTALAVKSLHKLYFGKTVDWVSGVWKSITQKQPASAADAKQAIL